MKTTHPVKMLPTEGLAAVFSKNVALRESYKHYFKDVISKRDSETPYVYFFAFPPDSSFIFCTGMPYTEPKEGEATDPDESLPPYVNHTVCPCHLHSDSTSN